MKTHPQTPRSSSRTLSRLGWLFLIPVLAISLPAQPGPELTIQQTASGECGMSWQVTTNEYVLLSAINLAGPWTPCLESATNTSGICHMTVAASHQCEYFKLVEGYYDDFEDGDLDGWTVAVLNPQATNFLTWEATNGQLRVYGSWPGSGLDRRVIFYRTNLVLADFTMSIDILGWDEGVAGDQANIVLMGRLDPSFVSLPDAYSYAGGVAMRHYAYPDLSALWLHESWPGGWGFLGSLQQIAKTDLTRDYRLVFSCVGSQLKVQLTDLTTGEVVDNYQFIDTSLTDGWVGFFVREGGASGTVDFTLDKYIAHATTP